MLRVAIVGCGKIADAHAAEILRIPGCELVAVADREELMARQLWERFRIGRYYGRLDDLLGETRPDIVHVTTPPASHVEIARKCLDAGCHVYVEKPFTLDAQEAETLVGLAEARNLKVTVGHDLQFTPAARRLRELAGSGYLGERVVHLEAHYGYDLGDSAYARAFARDRTHWVRKLPGGLLQNIISHGIARVAEFLAGDQPHVVARGFVSPFFRAAGEEDLVDELRATIVDERCTTAYFTFSSQMRPLLNQLRIYGDANALLLDEEQQTVIRLRGRRFKSHAQRFIPPVSLAVQYLGNWVSNARRFLRSELHMEAGKRELIRTFYRSIREGTPPPISNDEILRTARLMDAIFEQVVGPTLPRMVRESPKC